VEATRFLTPPLSFSKEDLNQSDRRNDNLSTTNGNLSIFKLPFLILGQSKVYHDIHDPNKDENELARTPGAPRKSKMSS
jgi:hypothetical protein